jgi:hypothetical protein
MILGFFTHGNNEIGSIRDQVTSISGLPASTSTEMLEILSILGFSTHSALENRKRELKEVLER